MTRRKPPMADRIRALLDPYEWDLIFQDLHDIALEDPDHLPSFAQFIIMEPLKVFAKNELKRNGMSVCYGNAAALLCAADAAIARTDGVDLLDAVLQINIHWAAWFQSTAHQKINTTSEAQSKKGGKLKTRNGVSPKDREKRNKDIITHFDRLRHRLTVNAFAEKYTAKYRIKPRTIREILSKPIGA